MTKIHVLNVRLPDEVIRWLDGLVKSGIYNSRSEAIRDFIREDVTKDEREDLPGQARPKTSGGAAK
ncbi:TPA: type II toxin-antitoxin system ParD family antitoxin [Candidatus Woesearchaeota archaeon]|nr:type II toxin-antitoxin system ParD family antitoxin [Candidatus Woesearchaeota archaeon]